MFKWFPTRLKFAVEPRRTGQTGPAHLLVGHVLQIGLFVASATTRHVISELSTPARFLTRLRTKDVNGRAQIDSPPQSSSEEESLESSSEDVSLESSSEEKSTIGGACSEAAVAIR